MVGGDCDLRHSGEEACDCEDGPDVADHPVGVVGVQVGPTEVQ